VFVAADRSRHTATVQRWLAVVRATLIRKGRT
jgi:hypothetical protein